MESYIDIFYLPDVDPDTPYRCFIWNGEQITDTLQHHTLDETVAWCHSQSIMVRVHDAGVRAELRTHGIAAHPPIEPAVERMVGE